VSDTPTPRMNAACFGNAAKGCYEEGCKLERELAEAKAKADNAKTALLTITAGHFYQSSCRGGEMERLMNQAIEVLGGKR